MPQHMWRGDTVPQPYVTPSSLIDAGSVFTACNVFCVSLLFEQDSPLACMEPDQAICA